jgi:hemerythrin-like metal-binding protein
MAAITWNETLALQQPRMDQTHREFVDLLVQLEHRLEAPPVEVLSCYDEFLAHTEQHFAHEERWMAAIGFAPENCHAANHANVLNVLREVRRRLADDADVATVRLLVPELAQWFPAHARSMDAALALTMAELGFDPETCTLKRPLAAGAAPITGCGSASCG